ncbi:Maltokinase [Emticicia aquatica]|uniref:Maltokinase n=1 Tax=Emticicia aquatica TaxID=1681835 RepID=A0ABM9APM0_9BACT|nr:phosphotransferase [Emticicia aquatica]CAH0995576.1 Maltokinase [Emticicia aquatica]
MTEFVLAIEWAGFEKDKYVHTVLEDNILPPFIAQCRWFAGKARSIKQLKVKDAVHFDEFIFMTFEAKYEEGDVELYLLPLSFVETNTQDISPKGILSKASMDDKLGFLVDAIYDVNFRNALFSSFYNQKAYDQINKDVLSFLKGKAFIAESEVIESVLPNIDSSNSAMIFDGKYFLKLYRKIFAETNPEAEMVEFITQNSDFKNIPRFAGSITWKRSNAPEITFAVMVEVVESLKDDWSMTGDYLNDFMEAFVDGNFQIRESVFGKVSQLAVRTAEMHKALFALRGAEAFNAEPFDRQYRRFLHQKFENLLERRYTLLTDNYLRLDEQAQFLAWKFMEAKDMILDFIDQVLTRPLFSYRTRIHGDYHLGQVLATEDDLVIIDFEGEPESTITERKIKHSPLKDVAGMIRSYHYAVSAKLFNSAETSNIDAQELQRAADRWYKLIKDTYLEEYLAVFGSPHPLFKDNNEINYLLLFHLLEKAVYEIGYEVNYRPTWVKIPLKGIAEVLAEVEKLRR